MVLSQILMTFLVQLVIIALQEQSMGSSIPVNSQHTIQTQWLPLHWVVFHVRGVLIAMEQA